MCDEFLASLRISPAAGRIRLLTEMDDAGLAELYAGALALVYPSLWEGFGLPVSEALSLGCPVLTSEGTAPAWVAGDAALKVDPEDETAIAAAMLRLIREEPLRSDLAAAGRERAAGFTWERAAAATLEVLRGSCRS
jgi:glycosyltransferase involved in cell wall biosynthesis